MPSTEIDFVSVELVRVDVQSFKLAEGFESFLERSGGNKFVLPGEIFKECLVHNLSVDAIVYVVA